MNEILKNSRVLEIALKNYTIIKSMRFNPKMIIFSRDHPPKQTGTINLIDRSRLRSAARTCRKEFLSRTNSVSNPSPSRHPIPPPRLLTIHAPCCLIFGATRVKVKSTHRGRPSPPLLARFRGRRRILHHAAAVVAVAVVAVAVVVRRIMHNG